MKAKISTNRSAITPPPKLSPNRRLYLPTPPGANLAAVPRIAPPIVPQIPPLCST